MKKLQQLLALVLALATVLSLTVGAYAAEVTEAETPQDSTVTETEDAAEVPAEETEEPAAPEETPVEEPVEEPAAEEPTEDPVEGPAAEEPTEEPAEASNAEPETPAVESETPEEPEDSAEETATETPAEEQPVAEASVDPDEGVMEAATVKTLKVGATGSDTVKADSEVCYEFTPTKSGVYVFYAKLTTPLDWEKTNDFFYLYNDPSSETFGAWCSASEAVMWDNLTSGKTYKIHNVFTKDSKSTLKSVSYRYELFEAPKSGTCDDTDVKWSFSDGNLKFSGSGTVGLSEDVKKTYEYWSDSVTSITIGSGITVISDLSAFPELTSVTISNTVTKILSKAMINCPKLKKITIPASVTKIKDYALGYTVDWDDDGDAEYTKINGFTIYGYAGSAAESYAKENGFTFKYLALDTPKPTKLQNTSTGLKFSWNSVSSASKYAVYRKEPYGTNEWKKLADVTGTSYTDTTVTSGVTYAYAVRARDGAVMSAQSGSLTLRYMATPKVAGVKNELSGINVTWNKTKGCSGYNVYRKYKGGSYKKIAVVYGASNLSWFDKTANNGTTYTYQVYAFSGNSVSTATSKTITRLTAPTLSSVTNSADRAMTIQWKSNTRAAGYEVKYTSGSFSKTITVSGSSSTSTTRTYLTPGKTFKVYVRCYQTVDGVKYYSAWSHSKSVTIAAVSPVYVSSSGIIHSVPDCSGMKHYTKYDSLSAALAKGFVKCSNCW